MNFSRKKVWLYRVAAIGFLFVGLGLSSPAVIAGQKGAVDAVAELSKADAAAHSGQYDLAAAEYERILKVQPQSAELWSNLGAMRVLSGRCNQAFPALEKARSLNAGLFVPWYFLGYCHLLAHRDEDGSKELGRAIALNPRDAKARFFKSQAEANLGHLSNSFGNVVEVLALDPNRPEGYYLAGKDALDLATDCYDRLLRAPGQNPYALILEGERNAAQGVWELAIQNYRKAEAFLPANPAANFSLATAYLESGRYSEAEAELRKCLESAPGSHWARLRLVLALAREGKSAEGARVIESVPVEALRLPEEFHDFIAAADLVGQPSLARRAEIEAGERFPEDAARRRSLAAASDTKRDGAVKLQELTGVGLTVRFLLTAESDAGNFLPALFPSSFDYSRLRTALFRSDPIAAAKTVVPLAEHLPVDAPSALALGEILHVLSYRFYERLAVRFPDSEPAMALAAENYSAMGQQEKALEIYQALLGKNGSSPEVLRKIAEVYWTQHQWQAALKVLGSLDRLDPYDPTIFVNIGRIYSYQQDWKGAEKSFRRAIELDPKMFEAHLGLGQSLRRQGDDEGAARVLKSATEIEPANPRTHYELSQVYRKLGNKEMAAKELADFERLQARAAPENSRKVKRLVPLD